MIKEPICFSCKHFMKVKKGEFDCKAFPKGIPDAILFGKNDHSTVYPGQTGDTVFEPATKAELAKS